MGFNHYITITLKCCKKQYKRSAYNINRMALAIRKCDCLKNNIVVKAEITEGFGYPKLLALYKLKEPINLEAPINLGWPIFAKHFTQYSEIDEHYCNELHWEQSNLSETWLAAMSESSLLSYFGRPNTTFPSVVICKSTLMYEKDQDQLGEEMRKKNEELEKRGLKSIYITPRDMCIEHVLLEFCEDNM